MAADGRLVFAAYGNVFSAFARNKEVRIMNYLTFFIFPIMAVSRGREDGFHVRETVCSQMMKKTQ
jgi:nitrate reductase NapE component